MKPTTELVSMEGRRVLITGASSGIGKAAALRFAEAGADLVLLDLDERGLSRTTGETEKFPCNTITCSVDLSQKEAIDDFWAHIEEPLPDTLINNAGIYPMIDYLELDQAFLDTTLKVNLESVFWMCQNFIKKRKDKGGVIVNVSSIEAITPFKRDMAQYSVSKAGVLALTRSLARDYGKQGFRANVVVPGAIRTPGTHSLVKTAIVKCNLELVKTGYDFQSRLALGRWGQPDEVARVILFLASDLSSYIQGAVIPVDGGFLTS
jgi:NAD(P)-dependent dehydrogenase (short-subunit alcohol dehydrogenase family)